MLNGIFNINKVFAVGFGYKTYLSIDNIIYNTYYSDYLCVKKDYRNKGIFNTLFRYSLSKHINKASISWLY